MNPTDRRLACVLVGMLPCLAIADALPPVAMLTEQDFLAELPVVLTTSRLSQPLDETPAPVTVITRTMIRDSGARTIAEVFRLVPGMLMSYDNGHWPLVTYHGMADEYPRRFQVLVDGRSVYQPVYGGVEWSDLAITLDDIDRIEVVRGPNAATYGANSFLAVVNIITRPLAESSGYFFRHTKGNNGILDGYLSYDDAAPGLDYRVTLGFRQDDGFPGRADRTEAEFATVSARYQASVRDAVQLNLGYTGGPRRIDLISFDQETDRVIKDHYEQIRWERSLSANEEISLHFYHNYHDVTEIFDFTAPGLGQVVADGSVLAERYDLEFQHIGHFGAASRFVWGAGVRRDEVTGPGLFATDQVQDNNMQRLFANLEYRATPLLVLHAGMMYERNDEVKDEYSPRIGANLALAPWASLRASVSRATRTPTLGETHFDYRVSILGGAAATTIFVGPGSLRSERITSRELGLLFNFPEQGLSLDVKLFNDTLRELITIDGTSVAVPDDPVDGEAEIFTNAITAKIRGGELALDYRAHTGTMLHLAQSYVEISSANPLRTPPSNEYDDSSPRHTTSVLLAQPLGDTWRGSLLYWRMTEYEGRGSGNPMAPTKRLDLRLGKSWHTPSMQGEVSLVVHNLLDEYLEWRRNNTFEQRVFVSLALHFD